ACAAAAPGPLGFAFLPVGLELLLRGLLRGTESGRGKTEQLLAGPVVEGRGDRRGRVKKPAAIASFVLVVFAKRLAVSRGGEDRCRSRCEVPAAAFGIARRILALRIWLIRGFVVDDRSRGAGSLEVVVHIVDEHDDAATDSGQGPRRSEPVLVRRALPPDR